MIQERTRLAREIHDGLAQTLAFLKMQTAQMQTAFHQGDTSPPEPAVAGQPPGPGRSLSGNPPGDRQLASVARTKTWSAGWNNYRRPLKKAPAHAWNATCRPRNGQFLPEISAQLVRIVQEALNNVRKHARASQVSINLRNWDNDMLVEIIDDGQGFDPDDIPAIAQYGLRGMRERAELIGADFQIISQPRRGTTVRLSLPMNIEETSK